MNKILTAVSVVALMSTGSYAIAQEAATGSNAGAGVTVDTPAMDAQAGAGANTDVNATTDGASTSGNAGANANAGTSGNTYSSVVSSITGNASVDLSKATDESKISIVLLSSLQGDATTEAAALDEALSANAAGQTTLHSNIEANAAIKAKLDAEGHTADDVVAVTSGADGSVVVYVDDRS